LGYAIDSAPARIDQRYVRTIEGRQVFVVESGTLAEQAIPGLQSFSGLLVLNDLINARANLVHLAKVSQFDHQALPLFGGSVGIELQPGQLAFEAIDIGPAVTHLIRLDLAAMRQVSEIDGGVEEVHAPLLPSRGKRFNPLGIGRLIQALIDR